ncbi:hypothetical protein COL154_013115 [Colletotrichum chrysophilum]|uniref:Uncharacterized protein n=1 Tax=Colletotrichum chrysophilum TaxID=1836956 RepID=A0AAD9AJV6_9PEZI|nr:hypothetical protein KNSL1_012798 [Colletotrichum chrysophilum]KAJ0351002.1 hypothetical protein COL154_013115 [Colletotrichum chrysophilum]KAK1849072.1 hypothetical protein CCHR01_08263 [Colletotrichum chrysophilum]
MSPVKLQLEDPGAPDYAGEVIDILNPAIASNSPSSQKEAALAIDALCKRECTAAGSAGGFLWWFWDLVHDLSRQLPYDSEEQDRLAAVIRSLTDLPPRNVSLGEEWGSGDASTVELWTNLPMFGNTFREKLDDDDSAASSEDLKKSRRVNLDAYAARVAGLCHLPFEVYAIWALVNALEDTHFNKSGPALENQVARKARDHKLMSAAVWMIHAGHLLYGRDEQISGATIGPMWKQRRMLNGTDGLSPERWQFWKARFAVLRDADSLDAQSCRVAGGAYTMMEKLENDFP